MKTNNLVKTRSQSKLSYNNSNRYYKDICQIYTFTEHRKTSKPHFVLKRIPHI